MVALHEFTLCQALKMMRDGECSSTELTQACLNQINRYEESVNAFITITPELALEQAAEADKQWAAWRMDKSQSYLPLLGLPIAVKDLLTQENVRCTCGSRILEDFIPSYTATTVSRLLEAGVVTLGKTNTDEFAMGSTTESSYYGATHNPWKLSHVPGGSSGGSAAAVAARFIPAALGTDTGGSVRQPASFCGVSGIKPTYGRTSRYGLVAFGSSLDTVGVLSRTVEDTAFLFKYMAGQDNKDATTVDIPVPDYSLSNEADLRGLRIGVPEEYFIEGMQREVEIAIRQAVQKMAEMGAIIETVSLPHTEYALPVYYLIAPAEASANLARYDAVRFGLREPAETLWSLFNKSRGKGFGPEVKRRIMLGTYALSAGYYDAYYGQAQKVRTLIKRDFEQVFEKVDVIAAPVAPTTAFAFDSHQDDPLAMYLEDVFSLPANLAGVPGLSFPVGFDENHLPVGMQLMGPHYREDVLFKIGHAYQQVTDWHLQKPELINS
jgi:aspartyl-tRNA(Asn)/glutamyl-tRNA(Gln) amidotransferase subunit A